MIKNILMISAMVASALMKEEVQNMNLNQIMQQVVRPTVKKFEEHLAVLPRVEQLKKQEATANKGLTTDSSVKYDIASELSELSPSMVYIEQAVKQMHVLLPLIKIKLKEEEEDFNKNFLTAGAISEEASDRKVEEFLAEQAGKKPQSKAETEADKRFRALMNMKLPKEIQTQVDSRISSGLPSGNVKVSAALDVVIAKLEAQKPSYKAGHQKYLAAAGKDYQEIYAPFNLVYVSLEDRIDTLSNEKDYYEQSMWDAGY